MMTRTLRPGHKVLLYLIFSAFCILGTYFGLPIQDAIANTRAIGAVLAGLIGGPVLGTAVGFTGGLHRYTLGGFTAFSCGVSTTVEGLVGGLIHLYLIRRGRTEQIFCPRVAFGTTVLAEALQMLLILLLSRPFDRALDLVQVIAPPMILANSAGAALFISIMRDQKRMYDKFGAIFSAKALKIADRTLDILVHGFNQKAADAIARIIHDETGVGAVAITDRETILAFIGTGSDHHRPGTPISAEITRRAIRENRVFYADGVREHFVCPFTDTCPLDSVLLVPLHVDNQVIGTIMLFEPRHKLFLNLNRTLGEGIANLLSAQLLRSRYEEQKNLLTQAELKLIQAQINPHFLFNTLNTIIAIIRQDAGRARDLLLHLSNFFRKNLKRSGDFATMQEELDHVHSYLVIEKARFEDRLRVETEVDPGLLGIRLPTFSLQPIIENAIKHGLSGVLGEGRITLRARIEEEVLRISIEDNGGAYAPTAEGSGLGINLVDKRIKNLCGANYGIEVKCEPGEWTRVTISLPAGGCA